MCWLRTEGTESTLNNASCSKRQLSAKANALLKENGIMYRSDGAVYDKIRSLEREVKLARSMMA